jgi:putative heme iron utilization protein
MADPITPAVSDRICAHMNDDHADAILLYAKFYGGVDDALAAQMLKVEPSGMNLLVQTQNSTIPVEIAFDHELEDSEDAHQTLIAMVREARAIAAATKSD